MAKTMGIIVITSVIFIFLIGFCFVQTIECRGIWHSGVMGGDHEGCSDGGCDGGSDEGNGGDIDEGHGGCSDGGCDGGSDEGNGGDDGCDDGGCDEGSDDDNNGGSDGGSGEIPPGDSYEDPGGIPATPKAVSTVKTSGGALVLINEICPTSTLYGNGKVELYNMGDTLIDVNHWYLANTTGYIMRRINDKEIPPYGFLVVDVTGLIGDRQEVTLYDSQGNERDSVIYTGAISHKDSCYARIPDGADYWEWSKRTLGGSVSPSGVKKGCCF